MSPFPTRRPDLQQQDAAVAEMDRQAAEQDFIAQQQKDNARMQQMQEEQAREAARAQKAALATAKRQGVKIAPDATGAETIQRHPDGQPVYEAGFVGEPQISDQGGAVAYRDARGQRYDVPFEAIRSEPDPTGETFYSFDVTGPDGQKQTMRQPAGTKPLFRVDPGTGSRIVDVTDPATGSVQPRVVGVDPLVANKAAIEKRKNAAQLAQNERSGAAEELRLQLAQKDTLLQPVRQKLREAQEAADKLAKEKSTYEQTADGYYAVTSLGDGVEPMRRKVDSPAEIAKADAWVKNRAATEKALMEAKAAHDPAAAEIQAMQERRDALALETLKENRRAAAEIRRMEEAAKAGQDVTKADWQQRAESLTRDAKLDDLAAVADLEAAGDPLAGDVQRAAMPDAAAAINRMMSGMLNNGLDLLNAGLGAGGKSTLERAIAESPTMTQQNGKPATTDEARRIAAKSLGITDPASVEVTPNPLGHLELRYGNDEFASYEPDRNRITIMATAGGLHERAADLIANADKDGVPVYLSNTYPNKAEQPFTAAELRDLLVQGVDAVTTADSPETAEAALAQAGLAPNDIRGMVRSGKLSVQDGRMMLDKFHGVEAVNYSRPAIEQELGRVLATSKTAKADWEAGNKAAVINRVMDGVASKATSGVVVDRTILEQRRQELMAEHVKEGTASKVGWFFKELIMPMIGIYGQSVAYVPQKIAKWTGYETEAGRLSEQQFTDWQKRTGSFIHKMRTRDDVQNSLSELRAWAQTANPGDAPPDDLADKIAGIAYDGYHELTDDAAKALNTSRDTFNVNRDPMLRAALSRYLTTADPAAFEQLASLLMLDGQDRKTQAEVSAYISAPRVASAGDVIGRAKGLSIDITPDQAGALIGISRVLARTEDPKAAQKLIAEAGKIMGLEGQEAAETLARVTADETDDPDSAWGLLKGGFIAGRQELLTEVASTAAEVGLAWVTAGAATPEIIAERAARQGIKTGIRAAIRRQANAAFTKLADSSTAFARTSALLGKARQTVGTGLANMGEAFAKAGIKTPTFGSPLSRMSRIRNGAAQVGKVAAVAAPIEMMEEFVAAIGEPAPSEESVAHQMMMGFAGGMILTPVFMGAASIGQAWRNKGVGAQWQTRKANYIDELNRRMESVPGFKPLTVADFDAWQGLQDNPAHTQARAAYQSALATFEQELALHQDAAAGNASLPVTPELLAARVQLDSAAKELELATSSAFMAMDELRGIPESERPLYTAAAKAATGARDFTEAEAKALMAQGGNNAVVFQQAEVLPADVAGPPAQRGISAPAVSTVAPGVYRLPAGVRIDVPPALLDSLVQKAPTMVDLLRQPANQTPAVQAVVAKVDAKKQATPKAGKTAQATPAETQAAAELSAQAPAMKALPKVAKKRSKLLATLKAKGVVVRVVNTAAEAEAVLGKKVSKGRKGVAQNVNGVPHVVLIGEQAENAMTDTLDHEAIHGLSLAFAAENPELHAAAILAVDPASPEFDAALDEFMRREYNGYDKLSQRQKFEEALRAIVEGRWKGRTSAKSKGFKKFLKAFLAYVRSLMDGSQNAALKQIVANIETALQNEPNNQTPTPTKQDAGPLPVGAGNTTGTPAQQPANPTPAPVVINRQTAEQQFNSPQGIDANAFGDFTVNAVESALKEGKQVTLITDGGNKRVPIVSVQKGMMRDVEGNGWGTLAMIADYKGGVEITNQTPAPVTPEPGKPGSRETAQITGQREPVTPSIETPIDNAPAPLPQDLDAKLAALTKGGSVSFSKAEKDTVNASWGEASPFNVPEAFKKGKTAKSARDLPMGSRIDDDTPVAKEEVLFIVEAIADAEMQRRNTLAKRRLVVIGSHVANDGGAGYFWDTDTVAVNPQRLARMVWAEMLNAGKAPTRRLVAEQARGVITHEIVHAAQFEAARLAYSKIKGDKPAFEEWVKGYYEAIWNSLDPEQQQATIAAYGTILANAPEWHRGAEASRMLLETGTMERMSEAIIRHLENVLAVLKRWYDDVVNGKADNAIVADEIERVQAVLDAWNSGGTVKPDAKKKPAKPKAQKPEAAATIGVGSIVRSDAYRSEGDIRIDSEQQPANKDHLSPWYRASTTGGRKFELEQRFITKVVTPSQAIPPATTQTADVQDQTEAQGQRQTQEVLTPADPETAPTQGAADGSSAVSDAEQKAADAMRANLAGLFSAPAPQWQDADIPEDRVAGIMQTTKLVFEAGIRTPEAFAAFMERTFPGGKSRPYVSGIWQIMGGMKRELRTATIPDWRSIYAEIDQPKQPSRRDEIAAMTLEEYEAQAWADAQRMAGPRAKDLDEKATRARIRETYNKAVAGKAVSSRPPSVEGVTGPSSEQGAAPAAPPTSFPVSVARALMAMPYHSRTFPMGDRNAELRQQVLEVITGERPPKSKAGANAVREALRRFFNVSEDDTTAAIDENIQKALQAVIDAAEPAPGKDTDENSVIANALSAHFGQKVEVTKILPGLFKVGNLLYGLYNVSKLSEQQAMNGIPVGNDQVLVREEEDSAEDTAQEREALYRSTTMLAADSPEQLRVIDVDRVMNAIPLAERPSYRAWLIQRNLQNKPLVDALLAWKPETTQGSNPKTANSSSPAKAEVPERGDTVTWTDGAGKEAVSMIDQITNNADGTPVAWVEWFGVKSIPLDQLTLKTKSSQRLNRERREAEAAAKAGIPTKEVTTPEPVKEKKPADNKALKEMKRFLLEKLDDAIAEAPDGRITPSAYSGRVVIEIPGDGTFTLVNEKKVLQEFAKRAKSFPTSTPSATYPKPTAIRPSSIPALNKAQLSKMDMVKVAGTFASTDETRMNIMQVVDVGDTLVATNGKYLFMAPFEGQGSAEDPMLYTAKGGQIGPQSKHEEDFGAFPANWRQVVPADTQVLHTGIDTGRLWQILKQASAVFRDVNFQVKNGSGTFDDAVPYVDLFLNPDGSVAVVGEVENGKVGRKDNVDRYEHNLQEGAQSIGRFNADLFMDILAAMRALGQEKVSLRSQPDMSEGALVVSSPVADVILMRVRTQTATNAANVEAAQAAMTPAEETAAAPVEWPTESRNLTLADTARAAEMTDEEIEAAATPVLEALRELEAPSGVDQAGIAKRGGSVYDDVLEGKFSIKELAAAHVWLRRHNAYSVLMDSMEYAIARDSSNDAPAAPKASGLRTQADTIHAGRSPAELLALAAPYEQQGPDYNRNIAESAARLRQSVERGTGSAQLDADELAVRLEKWAPEASLNRIEQVDMRRFSSDLNDTGVAYVNGDRYAIKQANDGTYYVERTRNGQREDLATGFADIAAANRGALEIVSGAPEAQQAKQGDRGLYADVSRYFALLNADTKRRSALEAIRDGTLTQEQADYLIAVIDGVAKRGGTARSLAPGLIERINAFMEAELVATTAVSTPAKNADDVRDVVQEFRDGITQDDNAMSATFKTVEGFTSFQTVTRSTTESQLNDRLEVVYSKLGRSNDITEQASLFVDEWRKWKTPSAKVQPTVTQPEPETAAEVVTTPPAEEQPAPQVQPAKRAKKSAAKIEDFGEKIGGARKDTWKERGLGVADFDNLSDTEKQAYTVKPQVFPKPDYQAWIDGGMPRELAYALKEVYDAITPKPNLTRAQQADPVQRDAALRIYVEFVSKIRDALPKITNLDELKALKDTLLPRDSRGMTQPEARAALELASKTRGNRYTLGGKMTPSSYDLYKYKEELEQNAAWPSSQEAWQRMFSIRKVPVGSVTSTRLPDGTYERKEVTAETPDNWQVIKSDGRWNVIVSDGHATREEAEAVAKRLAESKKGDKGGPLKRPLNPDARRVGPDYRNGRDVTGQDLLDTFGFRGGEFGNWTNEADRQQSLNQAYDGLLDLARVLNLPPKALSLNGELGIAFGARGSGKASAHYEPAKVVINLTRTSGAGALAHEWAHAVDDYFGRMVTKGQIGKYVSHGAKGTADFRIELAEAINAVMKAIDSRQTTESEYIDSLKTRNSEAKKALESWLKSVERVTAKLELTQDSKSAVLELQETLLGNKLPEIAEGGRPNMTAVANEMLTIYALQAKTQKERISWPVTGGGKMSDLASGLGRHAGTIHFTNSELAKAEAGTIEIPTRMVETSFLKESKEKGDYWQRRHELFARAFEAFVEDSIRLEGNTSPYLVQSTFDSGAWGSLYPQGDERTATNEALRKMAATFKTRDTGKGVALFSAPAQPSNYTQIREVLDTSMPRDRAEAIVRNLTGKEQAGKLNPKERAALEEARARLEQDDGLDSGGNVPRQPAGPRNGPPTTHIMPDGYELTAPGMHMLASAPVRAYHGTPHKVDKFRLDKIGTGEGAQAYGWGLYFAENRDVGELYQRNLSAMANNARTFEKPLTLQQARKRWEQGLDVFVEGTGVVSWQPRFLDPQTPLYEPKTEEVTGNLYTVELLPDEGDFLDWDKPLSEQSEKVKTALAKTLQKVISKNKNEAARFGYDLNAPAFANRSDADWLIDDTQVSGAWAYGKLREEMESKEASRLLASLGIPGIRYLDQGSRGAGDGTRNFVIFDENLVRILEENGKPVSEAPLASAPVRSVTPAQDAEYMAAVEAGDMEKAQRMVDEAAKSAGYKSASVIHSTNAEFNSFGRVRWVSTIKGRSEVITPIKSTGIGLIYATQDSAYSALFGDKQLKLYHNISNPADLRSLGSRNVSDSAFDAMLSTLGIAHKSSSMGAAPVFERLNKGQHKKAMLEAGFDGFALRERSGDLEADAIAGFDSSQFKSADPVTRDESGNVIPLSQRFNPQSDSILRSAPVRSVTPAQDAEYMAAVESGDMQTAQRMVDEAARKAGLTDLLFHGTDSEFTEFDPAMAGSRTRGPKAKLAFWFTESERHALERGSIAMPVFLRYSNPLTIKDLTDTFDAGDIIEKANAIGHDAVIFEKLDDLEDSSKGVYSVALVVNDGVASQIKSADPVTRDESGNVIPLSQRFNPQSDSILRSAPAPKKPNRATQAMRDIIESLPRPHREVLRDLLVNGMSIADAATKHNLSETAVGNILRRGEAHIRLMLDRAPTKPTVQVQDGIVKATDGRPDLAMSGNAAVAAVDQRRMTPEEVTHAEMQELATRLFDVAPAEAESLVVRWMDSGTTVLSTDGMPDAIKSIVAEAQARNAAEMLMTAAAKMLVARKTLEGGNSTQLARLIYLYRNTGTEQARALGMRRDPFDTPEERAAMYLSEALLTPPDAIKNELRRNPANRDRILAAWAKRADEIKAEMLAHGIDLDATFADHAEEQKLVEETIPEPVQPALARAPKKTRQLVKAIMQGMTPAEAIRAAGMTAKAAFRAYQEFRASLNQAGTEAAQAMRDQLLRSAPAPGADFAANLGLPDLTEAEWLDAVQNNKPLRTTPETEKLKQHREKAKKAGTLDLKNSNSTRKAIRAIEERKSNAFEKISEFWRASILSGPQTHVVNLVSGLTYGAYEASFKKLAAGVQGDIARMFGAKPDAASLADVPAMIAASLPSIKLAFLDGIAAWKSETRAFENYALQLRDDNGKLFKEQFNPALKGTLGKVMRGISFRLMGAADEFVKSFFTRIEVAAQARQIARNEGKTGLELAKAIQELMEPGSLAWERALGQAKKITFQTEIGSGSASIDAIDGLAQLISRTKKGDFGKPLKGLAHFTFPFVDTPTNIFKAGVTMSPVGGLLALVDMIRAYNRYRKGNAEEAAKIYNAARALDDLTNQIVAWGFILGLSHLVKPGDDEDETPFITGTIPWRSTSPGERELAYRTAPPQSIRIGDRWISYKRLDPFASALAFTVDSIKEFQSGKPIDEVWTKIGLGMMRNMQDKTFLQGVSDVVNAIQDPERFGTKWATNIATGFIPNLIRQPIRTADDVFRETDLPNDLGFWDALGRRMGYGIYPQGAMPAITVWGEPARKDTGTGGPNTDWLLRLLSPADMRAANVDMLDVALLRYNATHQDGDPRALFGVTAPSRELQRTIGGQVVKISLDDTEYEDFITKAGKAARQAIGTTYEGRDLTEQDVDRIKDILSRAHETFRNAAFVQAVQKRGGLNALANTSK